MATSRRDFLWKGLITAGAAAGAATTAEQLVKAVEPAPPVPNPNPPHPSGCFLGADGKLVHIGPQPGRPMPLPVIDQGRIVERGTHRQLVAAGGKYAQLYRQFVAQGE